MSTAIELADGSVVEPSSPEPNTGTATQPFAGLATAKSAAIAYMIAGMRPVPLPPMSKKPTMEGWPNFACTLNVVGKHFAGGSNIAVMLGEPSGGVVDVDLDTPEAVALAPHFLPDTDCTFGRHSSRASHHVYRVDGAVKTFKRSLQISTSSSMLCELRSTGGLTVFPPSTHPSGELVEFEPGKAGKPTNVSADTLSSSVNKLAAATALARSWPKGSGVRQDLAMAVAGGLVRTGMPSDDVVDFVGAVAEVAGDDEVDKRQEAAKSTVKKHAKGENVTGWPKVIELLGTDGKQVVDHVRKWLGDTDVAAPTGKLDTVLASKVPVEMVEWFWTGRVPYGAITIIDGDPGTGKSTMCIDLAARLTKGAPLPGGGECEAAGVVVLTGEDNFGTTVVPRLKAAGANLDRVSLVNGVAVASGVTELVSIPEDIPKLRQAVEAMKARLIVIDPFVAYISLKTQAHHDQQVRRALAPLAKLAEETGAAVVVVRHLTKKPGGNAMYRGGGSIGLIGAARSGLFVGPDPSDPSCHVLAVTKSNLASTPPSWRYRIVGKGSGPDEETAWEASSIDWLGTCDVGAFQLAKTSGQGGHGAVKVAMDFLKEVLKNGPVPAKDVKSLAKDEGHAEKTIRRAADKLGVVRKQLHSDGKIAGWEWSLPAVPSGDASPGKW